MSKEPEENAARRLAGTVCRLNRQPKLLQAARQTRERLLGDEALVDHLSTARGRPSDLAAKQLVELRGEEHGVLGELGLTALQAWQRLAESQDRGRGKVDVAIPSPTWSASRAGRWRRVTSRHCGCCGRWRRRSSRR